MELERNKGAKLIVIERMQWKDPQKLEPDDFAETFKNFCLSSLYIKEEVIKAL